METVIMSLHPVWWEKITTGEKRLEIRKSRPRAVTGPFRVLVYVTGGVGVCGAFICPKVHQITTAPVIQKTIPGLVPMNVELKSCLNRMELEAYAGPGGRPLWAWEVGQVVVYEKPVQLFRYGLARPPQSWAYFTGQEPVKHCVICGKKLDRVEPCPYNERSGGPTCPECCEECYIGSPFPCPEHDRRRAGNKL